MNQNALYQNQPIAVQPQMHFCFKCRWEGRTVLKACPRCGRHLFSQRNVRLRGVALVVLGLFLSGFMSAITIFVTGFLASAAKNPRGGGAKFNGDANMLLMIYILFGALIAGGLTAAIGGAWQAIFGRRNMFLMWISFVLVIVAIIAGSVFRGLAD